MDKKSHNFKRISALMLVMVIFIQSMVINSYADVPTSAGKGVILINDDVDNMVYAYEENGESYKAVESINSDLSQVSTKIYKRVNGEYQLTEFFVTYITNLGQGYYKVEKVTDAGITTGVVELSPTAAEAYNNGTRTRGAWELWHLCHFQIFASEKCW